MNIEVIKWLKERAKEMLEDNYNRKIGDEEIYTIICELENFYTAYEKEKKENKKWQDYVSNDLEKQITEKNNKIFEVEAELEKALNEKAEVRISVSADNQIRQLQAELEKEKEKNKKIDEFCRKELAFERRLKRENREPDEFNQGRFYVSENIRKIIEEE